MNPDPSSFHPRPSGCLLLLLLLLTSGSAWWLLRSNELDELRSTLEPRLAELARQGQLVEAALLVDRVNRAFPGDAPANLLDLNYYLTHLAGLNVADQVLQLLDAGAMPPVPPASNPQPPLQEPLPGRSEVCYLTLPHVPFAELFVELMSVLGKGEVQRLAPEDPLPRPTPLLVVAPDPALNVPAPDRGAERTVFLGPSRQAEQALGLGSGEALQAEGCRWNARSAELGSLHRFDLHPHHSGRLTVYRSTSGRWGRAPEVLATIECGGQSYPALYRMELDGGASWAMFTFSFPEEFVRLRQGDPALADREVDGVKGLRPSDLFGADFTAAELLAPQADLLAESLVTLLEGSRPSIRLWNHPAGHRSTLLVTSDQDKAAEELIATQMAYLRHRGVRATFLLSSGGYHADGQLHLTAPSPGLVAQGQRWGMHFTAHPNLTRKVPLPQVENIRDHLKSLREGYGITDPLGTRFHFVRWQGWVDPARWLQDNDLRYDLSFITVVSRHLPALGYMTGSGLPLRLYDEGGTPLSVRELATQLDDHPDTRLHASLGKPEESPRKLGRDVYFRNALDLVTASATRYHSPLVVNNHPQQFFADPTWLLALVRQAETLNVALYNLADYDAFLQGLLASRTTWEPATGTHHLLIQLEQQELVLLDLPRGRTVLLDREAVELPQEERWGRPVAVLTVSRGRHTLQLPQGDRP